MFKMLISTFGIVFLCSCASTKTREEFQINILLNPKFPITLGLSDTGPAQAQLRDNDGNVYITYWDVEDDGYKEFGAVVRDCREALRDQVLFLSAYTIHEYKLEDMKPSLYKQFVSCISEDGYTQVGKEAHFPEYFELSFKRTHNTDWNYMSVGSSFIVTKPDTPYIEAFTDTLSCDSSLISSGINVEDTYSYDYRRVSIEKYVEEFESCLSSKGYSVEKIGRRK